MFDGEVAAALMQHTCGHLKPPEVISAMAQEWCAGKRDRRSCVTPDQHASMYVELQARIQSLPPCMVLLTHQAVGSGGMR